MEWIELKKDNLPDVEVLAANFKKHSFGFREKLIGYLHYDIQYDFIVCETEREELHNCTHYIPINEFDIFS